MNHSVAPALPHRFVFSHFGGLEHDINSIFAVILLDYLNVTYGSVCEPSLAPSETTAKAASTTAPAISRGTPSFDSEAEESNLDFSTSSYRPSSTGLDGADECLSMDLHLLSEEKLLQGGVLRPVRFLMDVVYTIIGVLFLGQWKLVSRPATHTKETKQFPHSKQRKGFKWQVAGKGQRKTQRSGRGIFRTVRYITMAAIFGLANLGSHGTGSQFEILATDVSEASRRSDIWTSSTPAEFGTRGIARDRILPGQVPGQWSTSDQTSESALGSIREGSSKTESGTCPAECRMAKVPEKGRGRVHLAEDQVPHQAEGTTRRITEGRGGAVSGSGSSKGSSCSHQHCSCRRNICSREAGSPYTSDSPKCRRSHDRNTQKELARCGGRGRRSSSQEDQIPHHGCRVSSEQDGQDGFLIGRLDSCYNVQARRPSFFCLVEVLTLDEDTPPAAVRDLLPTWRGLGTPVQCQITTPSSLPTLPGGYGPRQAEYVAQLMRIDVETGLCDEAFNPCMWDGTMGELWHLDQIERSCHLVDGTSGIPTNEVVRQIEGRTLWALLAMMEDDPCPGGIEGRGPSQQPGQLGHLWDFDRSKLFESLGGDCQHVSDLLRQLDMDFQTQIVFSSYGHFDVYQGERTVKVPLCELHLWQEAVQQLWSEFEGEGPFALHLVAPQPPASSLEVHVIVRPGDNLNGHHFLLVDKIVASPRAHEDRFVIQVSQQPVGYEILLTSGIDLNTVTPRTILRQGNDVWQHHWVIQAQDGQYWRILCENDEDDTSLLQSPPQADLAERHYPSFAQESSGYPHVNELWCGSWIAPGCLEDDEPLILMQRPVPSISPDLTTPFHFFWLETGRVQINIAHDNVLDLATIVENHLRLPSQGPSSIRTFHYVANPPQLAGDSHNVNIMELREDADHRLMNDDVLCLYQITIQHPDRTRPMMPVRVFESCGRPPSPQGIASSSICDRLIFVVPIHAGCTSIRYYGEKRIQ